MITRKLYEGSKIDGRCLGQFQFLARNKFMAGILEHPMLKGLDRMTLLQKVDACKDEVMDLWFYLYAMGKK